MIDKNSVSVILCAGKGSRMNSACPKVLNTICGKSMLNYILDAQIESGICRIIIVCNNENINELKSILKDCVFVIQNQQRGTADAIEQAKNKINSKNVLVLFGDTPLITLSSIKKLINNIKSKLD